MIAVFRGVRVRVIEITGAYAWVQYPGSDNRRRVRVSDLEAVPA